MDNLTGGALGALLAVLAAALKAAWPVLTAYAEVLRQRAWLAVQERLGEAAARTAAEIAAQIAASPEVQAASKAMVQTHAQRLAERFRETMQERGVPSTALEAMLTGELGKLGIAVK